jgi:hypothetical protein
MIFILLSFLSVPLEGSGEAFIGYYPTPDTMYNTDVSLWMRASLVRIKEKTDFFAQYSSYLEMAAQEGKVIFDPAFSSYSFVFGFQYTGTYFFSLYVDHSCRHLIDRDLEEGKVVFNALNFVFSNIKDPTYRFSQDLYYSGSYIFYPQGIFVDWLNSKPYYRYRFIIEGGKKIWSFSQLSLGLEYTVSNDVPHKVYYQVYPEIEFFKRNKSGTFYAFIKYYLKAKGPLRSPEKLLFLGTGYSFDTPCK